MKVISPSNILDAFHKYIHKIRRLTVERFRNATSSIQRRVGVTRKEKKNLLIFSGEPR